MSTLLSLDIATNIGFAFGLVGEGRKPMKSGTHRFDGESAIIKCANALVWTSKMMDELQPDQVVLELPFLTPDAKGNSNPNTMKLTIGLHANISTAVFLKSRKEPVGYYPSTVRKLFIGKGTPPRATAKPLVHSRCCELGWADDETGFDETDAQAIWAARACEVSIPFRQSFVSRMPENADAIMREVKAKLDDQKARRKARAAK
ncbi:hypothetical protein [Maritalea porphyrae]|uniref:hypothetical protein n=1 Tax=Maritalea porphyrae TaxID=880732 RepID=UPI0022AF149E|nr:hypothetical protein [Maritalea porphyrae]MCZ4270759.1 hypothetical protein [Maritalea porphyrae]